MTLWKEGDPVLLPAYLGGHQAVVHEVGGYWEPSGVRDGDLYMVTVVLRDGVRKHAYIELASSQLLPALMEEPPDRAVVLLTGGRAEPLAFQRMGPDWYAGSWHRRWTWAEVRRHAAKKGARIVWLVEAPEQLERAPRVWDSANDDDWLAPADVSKVKDCHGDAWERHQREWCSPNYVSRVWGKLLHDFSPLTEVVEGPPEPRVWTIENEDDHTEPANVRKVTDHEGDTWERGDEDWAWAEHCRPWRVLLGDHGPLTEVVV